MSDTPEILKRLPARVGPFSINGATPPYCQYCRHPVDLFMVQTPIHIPPTSAWETPPPWPQMKHTGELLVVIKCHGQAFAHSNWHGELDAVAAAAAAAAGPQPRR